MIVNVFALFDTKAQYFTAPWFYPHAGQAIRACIDLGSDLNTTVGRHPADFHLYQIATYDDQTAALAAHAPVSLGVVTSFLPSLAPAPLFEQTAQREKF